MSEESSGRRPGSTPTVALPSAVRAVIDVGTNSVKILVAQIDGPTIHPLLEASEQTRLGSGFYENNQLQAAAIAETAKAVADFAGQARRFGEVIPRVFATSAARDSINSDELRAAIRQTSGLEIEIITGEQEAEWVFQGVATDANLLRQPLLIVDVGGGSTEFILGQSGHHTFRQSFPLGSVRLMEQLRPADPPSIRDLTVCRERLEKFFSQDIAQAVEAFLDPATATAPTLVGTGGTATILARIEGRLLDFNRDRIEGMILSRDQVLSAMVHLWSVGLAERRQIVGLPSNRADIILMGVAIYEAIMNHFHFDRLYISTRGLRFGALQSSPPP